jgi:hypothetical protein
MFHAARIKPPSAGLGEEICRAKAPEKRQLILPAIFVTILMLQPTQKFKNNDCTVLYFK